MVKTLKHRGIDVGIVPPGLLWCLISSRYDVGQGDLIIHPAVPVLLANGMCSLGGPLLNTTNIQIYMLTFTHDARLFQ